MSKLRRALCVEVSDLILHIIRHFINNTVQVTYDEKICIANILYYFCLCFGEVWLPLAMAELFSEPDAEVLSESSGTVYLCDQRECLALLPITSIHSVIAMFPNTQVDLSGNISVTGRFSLMQHPYVEVAEFTSDQTFDNEEANID